MTTPRAGPYGRRTLAALVLLGGACASRGASAPGGAGPDAAAATDDGGADDAAASLDGAGGVHDANDAATEAVARDAAGCSALPLCDGFEEDTPGTPPSGFAVVMGCNPNTTDAPAEGGGLLIGVDAVEHHGGKNSVRVVGGDSCGYYIVDTSAFARLGPQVYARFWVKFSSGPTQGHNGFLSMATTGGDHFRLGFQDSVVAWNAQTSDATLPDMDPQGTSLSIGASAATWTGWNCIEFHLDEAAGHLEFWFGGSAQPVSGLSYDGSSVQGVDDQWFRGGPSPAVPTSLGLGWLGLNDQQTVWFDDVALSADGRIGCD